MIDSFGGILNFAVFIALTLGWAMYAFQMSLGIDAFYGKFNISRTATIIGGFVGSFAAAAVIMHLILLFNGLEGAWYLFAYFIVHGQLDMQTPQIVFTTPIFDACSYAAFWHAKAS